MPTKTGSEFERAVRSSAGATIAGDFWHFLKHSRQWWMVPFIVTLLGLAAVLLLPGTVAAPFIYTLF